MTFCHFSVEIDPELILEVHEGTSSKTVMQMSQADATESEPAKAPSTTRHPAKRGPSRPLTI